MGVLHRILRGTLAPCGRQGRNLLLVIRAKQECVVLEPQGPRQNSFQEPNTESLWGRSKLSLFLRGARRLREAQSDSEVVLAPQQHEQTPSVSGCFEELVTVPCAKIECRGQIWLSYLCKEGSGKPAMIMPLYRLSILKFPDATSVSICTT